MENNNQLRILKIEKDLDELASETYFKVDRDDFDSVKMELDYTISKLQSLSERFLNLEYEFKILGQRIDDLESVSNYTKLVLQHL